LRDIAMNLRDVADERPIPDFSSGFLCPFLRAIEHTTRYNARIEKCLDSKEIV
jgi:hypothetical protein